MRIIFVWKAFKLVVHIDVEARVPAIDNQAIHKKRESHERFTWFGRVPTSTAKESSFFSICHLWSSATDYMYILSPLSYSPRNPPGTKTKIPLTLTQAICSLNGLFQ